MGAQSSAGRVLENPVSRDRIGHYCPPGRDGHQIHPRRVERIDSVKINPSLVMMRECIRAPPRGGRYWEIHPRRPRDFLRPERFPEGEARGKSRGSREISRAEGMDFPIPPESWWSTDILSSSNFLQGVDQQILPCGQGRIDSVKINPSLLMMREWIMTL